MLHCLRIEVKVKVEIPLSYFPALFILGCADTLVAFSTVSRPFGDNIALCAWVGSQRVRFDCWLLEIGNSTVTFGRFPRTSDLFQRPFFWRCSCAVQHSQLTLSRPVFRFPASLLAPGTSQSHLHRQMEELEGLHLLSVCFFTVNFCQPKKVKMLDPSGCF